MQFYLAHHLEIPRPTHAVNVSNMIKRNDTTDTSFSSSLYDRKQYADNGKKRVINIDMACYYVDEKELEDLAGLGRLSDVGATSSSVSRATNLGCTQALVKLMNKLNRHSQFG